jgi:hypothetical protein
VARRIVRGELPENLEIRFDPNIPDHGDLAFPYAIVSVNKHKIKSSR